MLGAWEFTTFGNILMGIMAIAGVIPMLYAVCTSMSSSTQWERQRVEEEPSETKKAAWPCRKGETADRLQPNQEPVRILKARGNLQPFFV
jgi:hypothetical protein